MKKLSLIIHQFSTWLDGKLQKRILHNSIYRASLLAITTVDTTGFINIITSCSTKTVRTNFLEVTKWIIAYSFNVNNLGRANSFTQSAGNTSINKCKRIQKPFFSSGIATKTVFTSHSRRNSNLFVREVDSELLSAHTHHRYPKTTEHIRQKQILARTFQD